ncbi:MAG: hypothetical protein LBJ01_07570 [Tannerella sp.]|nr:hypothetical protein [Tannerella sp.]
MSQCGKQEVASCGIPDLERIIRESRIHFDIQTVKWGKDGEEDSHSPAQITPLAGNRQQG